MISLQNLDAVITGASEGLGKSIAEKLASQGCNLALIARNKAKLESLKERLVSEYQVKVEYYQCDISNSSEVDSTMKKINSDFGKVDILINNAGVWYEGNLEEHSTQAINRLFEVNILGMIYTTKELLPSLKSNSYSQILNIASIAGVEPSSNWGVYTASKHAVRGFTDSLMRELEESSVKVMGFYPGGMNTELFTTSGFHKFNEPWMMNKDDIAEIIIHMLMQPKDINMRHVEVAKKLKF